MIQMTPERLLQVGIYPAMSLLPEKMDAAAAERMLVAMALQESALRHRHQVNGPAHGWWQFEKGGGVAGVLRHHSTREHATKAMHDLGYPAEVGVAYDAIEHNDVLAAVFARLLLWTLPAALATNEGPAWSQYIEAWRPGKPHPDRWSACWAQACRVVIE